MAGKEKQFSFDRSSDSVVITRDFDHGVISAKKGDTLSADQMADLSDDAVRQLVKVAKVAKIAEIKSGSPAKAGNDDKGAAKP